MTIIGRPTCMVFNVRQNSTFEFCLYFWHSMLQFYNLYLHLQFNIQVSNFSTPIVDLTLFVSPFSIQVYAIQHSSLRNRPFPSSLVPLFQNESKCESFHMKMSSACSFIFMHIEVIFIRMVSHLDSLWNTGARELGNSLFNIQLWKMHVFDIQPQSSQWQSVWAQEAIKILP